MISLKDNKIYIAICTTKNVTPEWLMGYSGLLASCFEKFASINFTINNGFPLDFARNECVKDFLAWDGDYLLFLDSDVIPPVNSIFKLIEDDVPIVSGLVYGRKAPHFPIVGIRADQTQPFKLGEKTSWLTHFSDAERLIKADVIGAGYVLIKKEVLQKMGDKWFELNAPHYTEDYYFCWKAQSLGFSIYVDLTVKCLHEGVVFIGEPFKPEDYYMSYRGENHG